MWSVWPALLPGQACASWTQPVKLSLTLRVGTAESKYHREQRRPLRPYGTLSSASCLHGRTKSPPCTHCSRQLVDSVVSRMTCNSRVWALLQPWCPSWRSRVSTEAMDLRVLGTPSVCPCENVTKEAIPAPAPASQPDLDAKSPKTGQQHQDVDRSVRAGLEGMAGGLCPTRKGPLCHCWRPAT